METPFKPAITREGERHPVTRDLPGSDQSPPAWGQWIRTIGADIRRGTPVMAGAAGRPLLVLSREDKGRVGLLLSDHAWLWARGYDDGGPHVDMLRRLAHWLMKEPALEEEALRTSVAGREIRVERQTMGPDPGPVTVTSPSGQVQTAATAESRPGLYTASVRGSELGLHTIRSGDLVAFASIGPANPLELADVFSDTERLRPLAEASGGSVRRVAEATGPVSVPRIQSVRSGTRLAGLDWIGIRPSEAAIVRGVAVFPLGLGLLGLAVLLGAVLLVWVVEGRRRRA